MMTYTAILVFICLFHSSISQDEIIYANPLPGGLSGDGITTRYWDCCKPSCAWADLVSTYPPVASCEIDGYTKIEEHADNGCDDGGTAFTCTNQQTLPYNDTLALGYVAASFTGGVDFSQCCTCVMLNFKGELEGKSLLAQIINTGAPLYPNHFDIAIPGGGVGVTPGGCEKQWNTPYEGWGDQICGISTPEECYDLPEVLQEGCKFRWEFLRGIPNPDVYFYQVECPRQLTDVTGCVL